MAIRNVKSRKGEGTAGAKGAYAERQENEPQRTPPPKNKTGECLSARVRLRIQEESNRQAYNERYRTFTKKGQLRRSRKCNHNLFTIQANCRQRRTLCTARQREKRATIQPAAAIQIKNEECLWRGAHINAIRTRQRELEGRCSYVVHIYAKRNWRALYTRGAKVGTVRVNSQALPKRRTHPARAVLAPGSARARANAAPHAQMVRVRAGAV